MHCEELSDEAIHAFRMALLDRFGFASNDKAR
jgi:hypothetical protein